MTRAHETVSQSLRRKAEIALRQAKKAMRAAGLSDERIDSFVQQVDNNCAGPCKTATQAYGSIIHALADALNEAETELADIDAEEIEEHVAEVGAR